MGQTSYLCRCRSSTKSTPPYLIEFQEQKSVFLIKRGKLPFKLKHEIPEVQRICPYNFADLQSLTWKCVLLDPSLIVPPI